MQLTVDTRLPRAARWALDQLIRILSARGEPIQERTRPETDPCLIIGLAGQSAAVDQALSASGLRCPQVAESLVLHPQSPHRLIIAGRDERGLTYALLEAARAAELSPPQTSIFDAVRPTAESPHLSWRSMQLFLCNRKLEQEWFYSEEFWDEYLTRLARCRYNNLSLTFGHQIAYLSPPYPFLVELPEYPQVRPLDFTPEECRLHLEMLARVATLTRQRGLHFTFGVWSQHAHDYGDPMVEGLTAEILAPYNAAGLAQVLAAGPEIDGVQFRMNIESGVPEDHQAEFYEPQFRAIAACSRPIRLDLRAKGLADATIRLARRLVPDTVISTKHWCEHLGMPYPMPAIQQFDLDHYRRYGTWDLLRKPRPYPLVHRLWSAGSQRALLWGDPAWVQRFAATCSPAADGFEIMAPLTNKGVRAERPPWHITADSAYSSHADEHRRYWMFYLLFGRLGYAPDTSPEVWRRELRHRFGRAADPVEQLYRTGSQILPLLTTALQWSASLWRFWPERFPGRSLDQDAQIEPSDPTQFYRIDEYVEDALQNQLCGKWTPPHVAHHLRQLAEKTRAALAALDPTPPTSDNSEIRHASLDHPSPEIRHTSPDRPSPNSGTPEIHQTSLDRSSLTSEPPELRHTRLDFTLLAHLAEYHACRLLAATHLALYRKTGESHRLPAIRQLLQQARDHWSTLSATADGTYSDDLIFGRREEGHCGHWKDDLRIVETDLATVDQLIAEQPEAPSSRPAPFPGSDIHPNSPGIIFTPPSHAIPDNDLILRIQVDSPDPLRTIRCHYRIANQALPFDHTDMRPDDGGYSVTIPGDSIDPAWDLMVFFELFFASGAATRWPDWRLQTPYFVIPTQ